MLDMSLLHVASILLTSHLFVLCGHSGFWYAEKKLRGDLAEKKDKVSLAACNGILAPACLSFPSSSSFSLLLSPLLTAGFTEFPQLLRKAVAVALGLFWLLEQTRKGSTWSLFIFIF